ncbi:MAG TPA: transcription antitermination factor NusB [Chloroflexia bacterium]|nr:transcription antitermination factor NusB [Chloroflexia bacterium]
MVMSIRRLARVLALQTLFEVDSSGHGGLEVLARHLEEHGLAGEGADFARALVTGVTEHVGELDEIIAAAAPNWPMDQMAKVDKNILRLAIQELLFDVDVPLKAAINEAVELGKRFGSDSSSRFINGVLGTVALQVERRRASQASRRKRVVAAAPEPLVEPGPELSELHGWLDEPGGEPPASETDDLPPG